MRLPVPHRYLALLPFLIALTFSTDTAAQIPNDVWIEDAASENGVVVSDPFLDPCCICCEPCCLKCSLTGRIRACRRQVFPRIPLEPQPQRYPYHALQMSYYARPYNASYYLTVDSTSYSDDVFAAAEFEVRSSLSPGTNLEYADSPQKPQPEK